MTRPPVPTDITVPEGWVAEYAGGYTGESSDWILIRSATGLMVTLDLHKRGYRSGMVTHGSLINQEPYTGRGWRKALSADAVTWLAGVEESIAKKRKR